MQGYIHFNGEIIQADEKLVGARNRGLRYGDGIFETIRVVNGNIPLLSYHFDRLMPALQTLQFDIPTHLSAVYLSESILSLCRKNNLEQSARIRLNVFRGNGTLFSIEEKDPCIIIEAEPFPDAYNQLNENGWVIEIYKEARKSCDIFSNLKSNNYLLYAMAALDVQKQGINDCLLLNNFERICDTTIANFFWVKDKQVFTPPLSEGCVAGVMRRYLIEKMREAGYAVEEQICTKLKLAEVDELFLTNALFGIRWVQTLRYKTYTNKMSTQLYNQFIKTLFSL
jgi:branched-chain amino acid aminotransferase